MPRIRKFPYAAARLLAALNMPFNYRNQERKFGLFFGSFAAQSLPSKLCELNEQSSLFRDSCVFGMDLLERSWQLFSTALQCKLFLVQFL